MISWGNIRPIHEWLGEMFAICGFDRKRRRILWYIRDFSPFLQNLINWTKLDSKLDYFGCTETLDITEFFNKMLFLVNKIKKILKSGHGKFFFRNFHFRDLISKPLDTPHFVSVITKSNFESNFNGRIKKPFSKIRLNIRKYWKRVIIAVNTKEWWYLI